jgi:hypothetical protein
LRRCDEKPYSFLAPFRTAQASDPNLEVTMKKEIFQDNKARWEIFEWMGSTQSKVIWAVGAAIMVLGIVYLIW